MATKMLFVCQTSVVDVALFFMMQVEKSYFAKVRSLFYTKDNCFLYKLELLLGP